MISPNSANCTMQSASDASATSSSNLAGVILRISQNLRMPLTILALVRRYTWGSGSPSSRWSVISKSAPLVSTSLANGGDPGNSVLSTSGQWSGVALAAQWLMPPSNAVVTVSSISSLVTTNGFIVTLL